MKITKKEKNSIVIVIIFQIFVLLLIMYYLLYNIIPNFNQIKNDKIEVGNLYKELISISKKGLTYEEYKELSSTSEKNKNDKYFQNLLSVLDKDFYNYSFENNKDITYDKFLAEKKEYINENIQKNQNQRELVSKILPTYLNTTDSIENNFLTNFKFINYIETILEVFNLDINDRIGISNAQILKEYKTLDNKGSNLDVNIFKIPLKLSLSGKKEGILSFIYFAQNIGNINIDEENGTIKVLNPSTLKKYNMFNSKNIYENQIFDIEYIKFDNYIDSSNIKRVDSNTTLYDFIISTQANQEYKAEVSLNFYAKGIAQYQLIDFINNVLDKYNTLNIKLEKMIIVDKYDLNIKKSFEYFKSINNEISDIRKQISKKENLEKIYSNCIEYNKKFKQIEDYINKK